MAKQVVGPLERHLEKAVVGVSALVLLSVFALYLVRSPNQIDLDAGERVAPPSVDAKIADRAAAVRERLRNAAPNVQTPPPLVDTFIAEIDPFSSHKLGDPLPAVAPFGPPVPIIDPPSVIEGDARLVDVLALGKPAVTFGRSTFEVPTPSGSAYAPTNWVTVSAVFDRKTQERRQAQSYGEINAQVFFGPVQLQRRTRRSDGSWSPDDWKTVETDPARPVPPIPEIPLLQEGNDIVVPREEAGRIERIIGDLTAPLTQVDFIRPLMHPVINGTPWTFPIITSYKDVQQQDDEFLNPAGPAEALPDRYGLQAQFAAPTGAVAPADPALEIVKNCDRLLAAATTEAECIEIYNQATEVMGDSTRPAPDRDRARKCGDHAEQRQRDIRRGQRQPVPGQQDHSQPSGGAGRERTATQQLWVHDASLNSLESGKTYQFRARAVLINPLAAKPLQFRDKSSAQVVFVEGPWSEPSNPVTFEVNERFFVTGGDERKEEITVELFQWFDGVWVKTRKTFAIGEKLATVSRQPVPRLEDPTAPDFPEVHFTADATLLDIDFRRLIREEKRGTGRGGVRYADPDRQISALFVRSDGTIIERLVNIDKSHPEKTSFQDRVWSPQKATTTGG